MILVRSVVLGTLLLQLAGCTAWTSLGGSMRGPASERTAVVTLLAEAQDALDAGDPARAGAALERALRIEPRNPLVWHRLASLRLQQKDFAQAASLAAKSSALAPADRSLRAANWRLIGAARVLAGDRAGAEQAYARARDLDGGR